MTLQFPYPATLGQVYSADNGVTYTYDGVKWVAAGAGNPLVPVSQLSFDDQILKVNIDGSIDFPNYQFPSAYGPTGTVLTSNGGGLIYWQSGGGGQPGPTGTVGPIGPTGPAGTQPNALINGQYSFSLGSNGFISMPDYTKLNSGGIGVTRSAEFGTEVNRNFQFDILDSSIYMGSGTGEFRSITQQNGKSLTYAGVENPGFAGFVAMDDGFGPNQYAVYADDQGIIHIGGTSVGYTTAIGAITDSGSINGILSNQTLTTVAGGSNNQSRLTIDDSGVTVRTGRGENAYGLWINKFGNFVDPLPSSDQLGIGVVFDSKGNLYSYGQVFDTDQNNNFNTADTLAIKYSPRGDLEWRKFYRPSYGGVCGTNDAIVIDENDNIYFMASQFENATKEFYIGRLDTDGNPVDEQGNPVPRYLKISNWIGTDFEAHVEGIEKYIYVVGTDDTYTYVLKIDASDYSIAWCRKLSVHVGGQITPGAITVNPDDGSVYIVVSFIDDTLSANQVAVIKLDNTGIPVWNKGLTPSVGYETNQYGLTIRYKNGFLYISIVDDSTNGTIVTKLNSDATYYWSTYVDQGAYGTAVDDIGFDQNGNLLLMGHSNDPSDITSFYLGCLQESDGSPIFHRTLTNGQVVSDYNSVILQIASVYENRVAIGGFGISNDTVYAITAQLATDGSATGTYGEWIYSNVTTDFNSRTTTNFTMLLVNTSISDTDFTSQVVGNRRNLNAVALLDEDLISSVKTSIIDYPGSVYTLGQDGNIAVPSNTNINTDYGSISITSGGQSWKFNDDGSLTGPGPIRSTAIGVPEFKSTTNLDLTAANRVNIKTSPLNLASFSTMALASVAGKNGDLLFNTTTRNVLTFADGDWRTLVRTTYNNDIVLIGQGTVRNSGGIGVVYQNELPRDLSDLTDNNNLLPSEQLAADLNIDGGGAYAMYDANLMQADGGFSGTRYGTNTPVWDGDNATTIIYTESFSGGGA